MDTLEEYIDGLIKTRCKELFPGGVGEQEVSNHWEYTMLDEVVGEVNKRTDLLSAEAVAEVKEWFDRLHKESMEREAQLHKKNPLLLSGAARLNKGADELELAEMRTGGPRAATLRAALQVAERAAVSDEDPEVVATRRELATLEAEGQRAFSAAEKEKIIKEYVKYIWGNNENYRHYKIYYTQSGQTYYYVKYMGEQGGGGYKRRRTKKRKLSRKRKLSKKRKHTKRKHTKRKHKI